MTFSLPWARDSVLTFAIEVAIVAGVLLVAGIAMRRRGRRAFGTRLVAGSAIAGGICGLAVVAAFTVAPTLPTPPVPITAQFEQNAVPNTAENIDAGRVLFQQNCAICHGPQGRGDGVAALTMNPRPVNLQLHVPQHPDGFLHYWISEGVQGTQMPAWKEKLSDTQIWQIVRFLRELAATRP